MNIGQRRKKDYSKAPRSRSLAEEFKFLLSSERALVKANDRAAAGQGLDRQNVKPEGRAAGAVFAEELPGHARKCCCFSGGDSVFRGTKLIAR